MSTLQWIGGGVFLMGLLILVLATVAHLEGHASEAALALGSLPLGRRAVADPHYAGLVMAAGALLLVLTHHRESEKPLR